MTRVHTTPLAPDQWRLYGHEGIREGVQKLLSDPKPLTAIMVFPMAPLPHLDASDPEPVLMHVHKAWGPAAYVGRPFHYIWFVGVLGGNQVASGSARMAYIDDPMDMLHREDR